MNNVKERAALLFLTIAATTVFHPLAIAQQNGMEAQTPMENASQRESDSSDAREIPAAVRDADESVIQAALSLESGTEPSVVIQQMTEEINADPDAVEALFVRGLAYVTSGDIQSGLSDWRSAESLYRQQGKVPIANELSTVIDEISSLESDETSPEITE